MSSRHARCLTNTFLHKENGLHTWWNVLKAAAADVREEAWRDQSPAPQLPTANFPAALLHWVLPLSVLTEKVPGTYCALYLFIFPTTGGTSFSSSSSSVTLTVLVMCLCLLLLMMIWEQSFLIGPTRKWSLGKEQGGFYWLLQARRSPCPSLEELQESI